MTKYKTIIGRAELLDLTVQLLSDIPAKTDTGAYLSSIHATNIREVKNSKGKKVLKFDLLANHPAFSYSRSMEVASYTSTVIANSFGHRENRFKIDLKVRMAGKVFTAPFTLADRSKKPFPVLLGRTLLNKRFIVDTTIVHADRRILKAKLADWLAQDDLEEEES